MHTPIDLRHIPIAIACSCCHLPGTVNVVDGIARPTSGFEFDEHRVPVCASCGEFAGLKLPPIDGRNYDVGPNCPVDELQQRLDAARALQRLNPPELGPVRRWSI